MVRWRARLGADLCVVILGWAAIAPVAAQDYPTRPVRVITPYAAGGGIDVLTRVVTKGMSEAWGHPVVVDNRPGAGATIGTDAAAKAAPDGYTLLVGANPLAISPVVYPNLPYDAQRDFTPIILFATAPEVLTINPALGVATVTELVERFGTGKRQLNFGSAGSGTLAHLAAEGFNRRAKLGAVHVPYKGSNPALIDLIANHIDLVFDSPTAVLPHVEAGKLRALAIASAERSAILPNLPTLAEAGYAGLDFRIWVGLVAPVKTPPALIARVQAAAAEALRNPEVRKSLAAEGWDVAGGSTDDFRGFLAIELPRLAAEARAAGVKAE
jgi:tripartite-type tricarboxylate transporter receptor subunit TctC